MNSSLSPFKCHAWIFLQSVSLITIPLLLFFDISITSAQTSLGGTYESSFTISVSGSPYRLTATLILQGGVCTGVTVFQACPVSLPHGGQYAACGMVISNQTRDEPVVSNGLRLSIEELRGKSKTLDIPGGNEYALVYEVPSSVMSTSPGLRAYWTFPPPDLPAGCTTSSTVPGRLARYHTIDRADLYGVDISAKLTLPRNDLTSSVSLFSARDNSGGRFYVPDRRTTAVVRARRITAGQT